jgi:hypothetical protein
MKKIIWALAFTGILASCGSDDGDTGGGGGNTDAVVLSAPQNNSECITGVEVNATQSTVTFEWQAVEGNQNYFVYVKNLETQSTLQYNAANNTSQQVTLEKGTPYSWYVRSNRASGTVQSETWKFYNSGDGISNYAPFPAELVAPAMSSSVYGPAITLQWTGDDLDNDIESYEVFFGTAALPTTSIHTGTQTSVNSVAVTSGNTYYWKVVTTDSAGNTSVSPVFQFKVL